MTHKLKVPTILVTGDPRPTTKVFAELGDKIGGRSSVYLGCKFRRATKSQPAVTFKIVAESTSAETWKDLGRPSFSGGPVIVVAVRTTREDCFRLAVGGPVILVRSLNEAAEAIYALAEVIGSIGYPKMRSISAAMNGAGAVTFGRATTFGGLNPAWNALAGAWKYAGASDDLHSAWAYVIVKAPDWMLQACMQEVFDFLARPGLRFEVAVLEVPHGGFEVTVFGAQTAKPGEAE